MKLVCTEIIAGCARLLSRKGKQLIIAMSAKGQEQDDLNEEVVIRENLEGDSLINETVDRLGEEEADTLGADEERTNDIDEEEKDTENVNKLRKSQRAVKSTTKVRENATTEYWETLRHIRTKVKGLETEISKPHPVSIQMNLKRDLKILEAELKQSYATLSEVLHEEVEEKEKDAGYNTVCKLRELQEKVGRMLEQGDRTSNASRSSKQTTSSRRVELAARADKLKFDLEAKRLKDQQALEAERIELETEIETARIQAETARIQAEQEAETARIRAEKERKRRLMEINLKKQLQDIEEKRLIDCKCIRV